MPTETNCFECGNGSVAIAPGPNGFVQSCQTCGQTSDLDDVLEPVNWQASRLTEIRAAA